MPSASTATQKLEEGQETPFTQFEPSAVVDIQALAPPVGSVEVRILPQAPTATQKVAEGQATDQRYLPQPITLVFVQIGLQDVGLVEVRISPLESVATQRVQVGQATLKTVAVPATPHALCQALAGPAGSVEVKMSPEVSPTAQRPEVEVVPGIQLASQRPFQGATQVLVHQEEAGLFEVRIPFVEATQKEVDAHQMPADQSQPSRCHTSVQLAVLGHKE